MLATAIAPTLRWDAALTHSTAFTTEVSWIASSCQRQSSRSFVGEDYFNHFYHAGPGEDAAPALDLWDGTRADWGQDGRYSAGLFAEKAAKVIQQSQRSRPLFLYLSFQSVHAPLQAPNRQPVSCDSGEKDRQIYCGMIDAMDKAVATVMQAWQSYGRYQNSLIIFSTDVRFNYKPTTVQHPVVQNGGLAKFGGNNWPLRGGKGSLFEGGTKVMRIDT